MFSLGRAAKKVEPKEAYIKAIEKAGFVAMLKAAGVKLDFLGMGTGDAPATAAAGTGAGQAGKPA